MRRTVLAILDNAARDGRHARFHEPREQAAVKRLAKQGIAHIVGYERQPVMVRGQARGTVRYLVARLA